MVREMAFVAYYVRDVAAAVSFYRDVLGLRLGEPFGDDYVEFDLGNVAFALDGSGEGLGIAPGSSSGAAFEVDDLETMRERLLSAGVEATEIYEFAPCYVCFARDPDGNRFMIHRRKEKP